MTYLLLVTRYIDATCNGASTASMTQPEPVLRGANPPQLSSLAYPFHPNRRGEQVMAARVLAALRS